MLVLTRKVGEQIVIDGKRIVITVNKITSDKVSIGIDAPIDVTILRAELKGKNDAENQATQDQTLIPLQPLAFVEFVRRVRSKATSTKQATTQETEATNQS